MTSQVIERWGSLSATGIGVEQVFGTPVLPTSNVPMTGNSLQMDPGLFFPKVQMGQRDLNIFPLYGQQKLSGSVSAPLFPSNGAELVVSAIGMDAAPGQGVVGSTPTNSTTMTSSSTAGATTILVAAVTGYVAGTTIVQIDTNTGTTKTSECRKVTTITGTTSPYTLTLDAALTYAHASASAVAAVVAPFTHTISQQNTLPSLTVEKNLGGYDSLQFAGCRINKLALACQSTNQEATVTADLIAQSAAVLDSPSPIAVVNENPFVFAEASLSLFGQTVAQAENFSMDIENGIKDTYTYGQAGPKFLTPVTRHISGKADVVFTSLDDATWGYYTQMANKVEGAVAWTLAHPNNGGTWTFNLPAIRLKTYTDAVPMDDVIKSSLAFEARLNLATSTTISATLVNSAYLGY
ncbi:MULTISPECIES: phage tail tube protein [Arthrobacter]|uniref:Uncharacterized protein n=1 Tax=Arthrobacter terricola TaxID=2547396 RepID=A0A4R5KMK5_9MICC|nr:MULTISPECIES: phage tail tube protein [Arthrobacter]MBT8160989.1 hypothetical protein [Arthrobacter sp. GN70]TDF96853.1 hypothetical protein E1809_09015 [Arthrobacter terricola]